MAFRIVLPVRFGDIDQAGVVYYPRFFHHFHVAFEEFFRQALGIPYDHALVGDRIGFPTVHIETDFMKPFKYGEFLDVELTILRLGEKSLTVQYRAFNQATGELSAVAKITSVCTDLQTFRSIPFPDKYRDALRPHVEG
ncbi:MAG: acyl-CoA thioesterase [Myxococcales bacterium]